jgi:hypothetical protein
MRKTKEIIGINLFLYTVIAPVAAVTSGQALTLKEMARANGGKASTRVTVNEPFGSWQILTASSGIIVHGQVASVEPRLTKNEDNILTYVSLAPLELLKGSHQQQPVSKPGFTSGIVFVYGGGNVVVDGLELTVINEAAPEPALKVGEQVVAFLTPMASEPGVLNLAYGSSFGLLRL